MSPNDGRRDEQEMTRGRGLRELEAHQRELEGDLRRAVHDLEQERIRLEEVFREAPAFLAVLRGGRHVFERANPTYRELVGRRDLIGRPVREVFPELEDQPFFDILDEVYRTGEPYHADEASIDLDTGDGVERRYLSFVYQPLTEDGEVRGILAHGVDVTEQVEARRKLANQERRLEQILSTVADGILFTDAEGNFHYANPAAAEILGLERSEVTGRIYRDPEWHISGLDGSPIPDEDLPVARVLASGEPVSDLEHAVARPDGSRIILQVNATPVRSEEGELEGVVASIRDITAQKDVQEALHRSEARHRTLVETMAEATVILDPEGRITFANDEVEALFGVEASDIQGRSHADPAWGITAPDGGPFPEEQLPFRRVVATGRPVRDVEFASQLPDDTRRILSVNGAPLNGEDGEFEGVVLTIRDISERHRMEAALRHRALHDALTGLPNRTLFGERIRQAMARGRRHGEVMGLLMLDVDRFKQINDELGHAAGDRVLEAVATRLRAELREEDTPARLGGDEFAILLPGLGGPEDLRGVRDRLTQALAKPYRLGGDLVEVDVTIGGVLHTSEGAEAAAPGEAGADAAAADEAVTVEEPDDLLRYADLALFQAKETSGPSFHLFRPGEASPRTRALGREQELRRAIREEAEFELLWQPIFRLEDGELWGVEPLARWRHPEQGLLSPLEFVPLADETGLIHELGGLLFRKICRHAAAWPRGAGRSVRITPNLSGRQFDRAGLAAGLLECVEEAGLEPGRFWLEITETALTREREEVQSLRELGFGVLIDDFGTGYSSFHYLRDQTFDGIKIDMSFVHGVRRQDHTAALVTTMVAMGRALDMVVVAEGIETEQQRDALAGLGCELGQGYLLARPMAADDLEELFSRAGGGA